MAVLYVTEYPVVFNDMTTVPVEPPVAEQTVAIGAGSLQSTPFGATTRMIRVATDSICSVKVGVNPTATATSGRMAAGQTEYRVVQPGQQIAVITNT